jgi:hypothetical protein
MSKAARLSMLTPAAGCEATDLRLKEGFRGTQLRFTVGETATCILTIAALQEFTTHGRT